MKKLSQKERGEVVTKGYLQDQDFVTKGWVEKQDFVTKGWVEKQDFATKTYVSDMFEVFEKRIIEEFKQEFKHHTNALMEFHAHQNKIIIEAFLSRIERIEIHVGLPSF